MPAVSGEIEWMFYTSFLLFFSPLFILAPLAQPELVQQTDLASTLAIGLGLPISRNSVGNLILPVVGGKTMREQLRFLHLNGFQLSRLLQENTPAYEKGKLAKKRYRYNKKRLFIKQFGLLNSVVWHCTAK